MEYAVPLAVASTSGDDGYAAQSLTTPYYSQPATGEAHYAAVLTSPYETTATSGYGESLTSADTTYSEPSARAGSHTYAALSQEAPGRAANNPPRTTADYLRLESTQTGVYKPASTCRADEPEYDVVQQQYPPVVHGIAFDRPEGDDVDGNSNSNTPLPNNLPSNYDSMNQLPLPPTPDVALKQSNLAAVYVVNRSAGTAAGAGQACDSVA